MHIVKKFTNKVLVNYEQFTLNTLHNFLAFVKINSY